MLVYGTYQDTIPTEVGVTVIITVIDPLSAPLIGTQVTQSIRECWIRCGCWIVPYGHGGQNAMSTYCGRCCGQGGTGGGGLVKITYF